MDIIISGRHLDVTEDMRTHIEQKLEKLNNDHFRINSVRIVLDLVRNMGMVEAHLHGKDLSIDAHGQDADMYAAIDQAISKLSVQVHKHWDKIRNHHGHPNYREIEAAVHPEGEEEETLV